MSPFVAIISMDIMADGPKFIPAPPSDQPLASQARSAPAMFPRALGRVATAPPVLAKAWEI